MPPAFTSSTSRRGMGSPFSVGPRVALRNTRVEVDLCDVSFLERLVHTRAFHRGKGEIHAIAEEKTVDRWSDEAGDAQVLERARRRPARAHAEVLAADEDVAGLHQVHPAGPVGVEYVLGLLRGRQVERLDRQDQVSIDVVADFPGARLEVHGCLTAGTRGDR